MSCYGGVGAGVCAGEALAHLLVCKGEEGVGYLVGDVGVVFAAIAHTGVV